MALEEAKNRPPGTYDTTFVLLPDLLLIEIAPEEYGASSFQIACIDREDRITKVLEDIKSCECRLINTSISGRQSRRVLWSAQRFGEFFWERDHFDNYGNPTMKDTLQTVQPYKYVTGSFHSTLLRYPNYKTISTYYFKVIKSGKYIPVKQD